MRLDILVFVLAFAFVSAKRPDYFGEENVVVSVDEGGAFNQTAVIVAMYGTGIMCLSWLVYQYFKYRQNEEGYESLVEQGQKSQYNSEFSTTQNVIVKQSPAEKYVSVFSGLYLLYLTVITIHVAHAMANHQHGIQMFRLPTRSIEHVEREVGVEEFVAYHGEHTRAQFEAKVGAKSGSDKHAETPVVDKTVERMSSITQMYGMEECVTLPFEPPARQNHVMHFKCVGGQVMAKLFNEAGCEDPAGDWVSAEAHVEAPGHMGDLDLSCVEMDGTTMVKAVQEYKIHVLPCDAYENPRDAEDCRKWGIDSGFLSAWECRCVGRMVDGAFEVHELDHCDLTSTPKERGLKALGSLLVEDGGDAYCKEEYDIDEQMEIVKHADPTLESLEFSVGDFPTRHSQHQFNGRRQVHADGSMSRVDSLREFAVGRAQKAHAKNMDAFHNHPKRDEMIKSMEKEVGLTYDHANRKIEKAVGLSNWQANNFAKNDADWDTSKQDTTGRSCTRSSYGGSRKTALQQMKNIAGGIQDLLVALACTFVQVFQSVCEEILGWFGLSKHCKSVLKNSFWDCSGKALTWDNISAKMMDYGRKAIPIYQGDANSCSRSSETYFLDSDVYWPPGGSDKGIGNKRRQLTAEQRVAESKFLHDVAAPAIDSYMEAQVGVGTEKVQTRDLVTGKRYDVTKSCPGYVWYAPGIELSVSIVGMFQSSNWYIGYGASRNGYSFEYYGASKGFETEVAAMNGQMFSLQYVNVFSEWHGDGKEFCLGGDLPGDFAGFDLCWSWAEGKTLNSFGFGLSLGLGVSPFSIGETTCHTYIHALSCL